MPGNSQHTMGTFSTPGYATIGDPYIKKKTTTKLKGKPQMLSRVTASKASTQAGYFTKSYERAFEKEPTHDAIRARRQEAVTRRKKMLGADYKGASPVKQNASAGSYHGTFSGQVKYFSGEQSKQAPKAKEKLNFMTNPAKKGTGYGYPHVTIGKMPEYTGDKYNVAQVDLSKAKKAHLKAMAAVNGGKPFRGAAPDNPQGKRALFDANPYRPHAGKAKPNKEEKKITVPFYPNKPLGTMGSGGNNFSTFTKMTYSSEKAKARVAPKKKDGPTFKPISNAKTMPMTSIVQVNVNRSVNPQNAAQAALL